MTLKQTASLAVFGIGALIVAVLLMSSYQVVPAGHRGVLTTWGKVDPAPLGEGLHFISPIGQRVHVLSVQILRGDAQADAASKDLQQVHALVAVNFHLLPEQSSVMFQQVGTEYYHPVIEPAVLEIVKAVTAQFTAEELITRRAEVRDMIKVGLVDRMARHSVVLDEFSIVNFNFSPSFNQAIEAKVTAAQQKLKAETDLQRIEVEAKQKISMARAEAETIKIQAEAVKAQGGAEYVQLKAIEKWNGALPTTMAGGTMPFLNLNK
ncbi:prohibitin family protein [soil metagenome]